MWSSATYAPTAPGSGSFARQGGLRSHVGCVMALALWVFALLTTTTTTLYAQPWFKTPSPTPVRTPTPVWTPTALPTPTPIATWPPTPARTRTPQASPVPLPGAATIRVTVEVSTDGQPWHVERQWILTTDTYWTQGACTLSIADYTDPCVVRVERIDQTTRRTVTAQNWRQ